MERCESCGTLYDEDEEEYCPKCGAQNIITYQSDLISEEDLIEQ